MQKGEVMTDRELLELAAKAAGINLQWMGGPVEVRDGIITAWNPLFDDGDALRLAVKLNLHVEIDFDEMLPEVRVYGPWVYEDLAGIYEDGSDPYTATRRAITRAAAEIGKMNKATL